MHFAHLQHCFFHQNKRKPSFARQCSGVYCKDPRLDRGLFLGTLDKTRLPKTMVAFQQPFVHLELRLLSPAQIRARLRFGAARCCGRFGRPTLVLLNVVSSERDALQFTRVCAWTWLVHLQYLGNQPFLKGSDSLDLLVAAFYGFPLTPRRVQRRIFR